MSTQSLDAFVSGSDIAGGSSSQDIPDNHTEEKPADRQDNGGSESLADDGEPLKWGRLRAAVRVASALNFMVNSEPRVTGTPIQLQRQRKIQQGEVTSSPGPATRSPAVARAKARIHAVRMACRVSRQLSKLNRKSSELARTGSTVDLSNLDALLLLRDGLESEDQLGDERLLEKVKSVVEKRGVVTEVGSKQETEAIPYHKQGDLEMYTKDRIQQRLRLRQHPEIIAAIDTWWEHLEVGSDQLLHKHVYVAHYKRVYKSLMADFMANEALESAYEEWNIETGGALHMMRNTFQNSMFELADLWSSGLDLETYVSFLNSLHNHLYRNGKWLELDDVDLFLSGEAVAQIESENAEEKDDEDVGEQVYPPLAKDMHDIWEIFKYLPGLGWDAAFTDIGLRSVGTVARAPVSKFAKFKKKNAVHLIRNAFKQFEKHHRMAEIEPVYPHLAVCEDSVTLLAPHITDKHALGWLKRFEDHGLKRIESLALMDVTDFEGLGFPGDDSLAIARQALASYSEMKKGHQSRRNGIKFEEPPATHDGMLMPELVGCTDDLSDLFSLLYDDGWYRSVKDNGVSTIGQFAAMTDADVLSLSTATGLAREADFIEDARNALRKYYYKLHPDQQPKEEQGQGEGGDRNGRASRHSDNGRPSDTVNDASGAGAALNLTAHIVDDVGDQLRSAPRGQHAGVTGHLRTGSAFERGANKTTDDPTSMHIRGHNMFYPSLADSEEPISSLVSFMARDGQLLARDLTSSHLDTIGKISSTPSSALPQSARRRLGTLRSALVAFTERRAGDALVYPPLADDVTDIETAIDYIILTVGSSSKVPSEKLAQKWRKAFRRGPLNTIGDLASCPIRKTLWFPKPNPLSTVQRALRAYVTRSEFDHEVSNSENVRKHGVYPALSRSEVHIQNLLPMLPEGNWMTSLYAAGISKIGQLAITTPEVLDRIAIPNATVRVARALKMYHDRQLGTRDLDDEEDDPDLEDVDPSVAPASVSFQHHEGRRSHGDPRDDQDEQEPRNGSGSVAVQGSFHNASRPQTQGGGRYAGQRNMRQDTGRRRPQTQHGSRVDGRDRGIVSQDPRYAGGRPRREGGGSTSVGGARPHHPKTAPAGGRKQRMASGHHWREILHPPLSDSEESIAVLMSHLPAQSWDLLNTHPFRTIGDICRTEIAAIPPILGRDTIRILRLALSRIESTKQRFSGEMWQTGRPYTSGNSMHSTNDASSLRLHTVNLNTGHSEKVVHSFKFHPTRRSPRIAGFQRGGDPDKVPRVKTTPIIPPPRAPPCLTTHGKLALLQRKQIEADRRRREQKARKMHEQQLIEQQKQLQAITGLPSPKLDFLHQSGPVRSNRAGLSSLPTLRNLFSEQQEKLQKEEAARLEEEIAQHAAQEDSFGPLPPSTPRGIPGGRRRSTMIEEPLAMKLRSGLAGNGNDNGGAQLTPTRPTTGAPGPRNVNVAAPAS
eukprot:TRINITY_DN11062_c0_g2_i1.p1 TRINITY_DN11062_c0_g2~~TRINITY_DN11062_c0_g2_i1.p1  ORF type:complete len:1451 (+),score=233.46 TRINITY_DN11062_c0_g2_i1:207-4559(+)